MRNTLPISIKYGSPSAHKTISGKKLSALLLISLFTAGCHTGHEPVPVPQVTVKKEETGSHKANTTAKELKIYRPTSFSANDKNKNSVASTRDPFALPAELQEPENNSQRQTNYTEGQQLPNQQQYSSMPKLTNLTRGQTNVPKQIRQGLSSNMAIANQSVLNYAPQEPFIAGIFDNGKEKFALIHWQQVQGIFRCGESVGNGFYVKEITAASVLISPETGSSGINSFTLEMK